MDLIVPWSVPTVKSSMRPGLMVPLSWGQQSSPESCSHRQRQEQRSPIRNWIRKKICVRDADQRKKVILESFLKHSASAVVSLDDFEKPLGVLRRVLFDRFLREFGMDG